MLVNIPLCDYTIILFVDTLIRFLNNNNTKITYQQTWHQEMD